MVAMRQKEATKNSKNRITQNRNISYWIYAVSLLRNLTVHKEKREV